MSLPPAKKKKSDYEPIPNVDDEHDDIESNNTSKTPPPPAAVLLPMDPAQATEWAKQQYPDLNLDDDQAKLMGQIDQIRQHAHLDLNLASCIRSSASTTTYWPAQAVSFVRGLVQPTVTACIMTCTALYLQAQQRAIQAQADLQSRVEEETEVFMSHYDSVMSLLILWFPYINATLVFLATVRPLQQRIMTDLVAPIFYAMTSAHQVLQSTVQKLGPLIDETIDGIQRDFHTVVKPIQPTLEQWQRNAHLVEQVMGKANQDNKLDIPDPSDIDRELDAAQGVVGDRIQIAQSHLLEAKQYVPPYLQSSRQFYWRILVPTLVLAWMLQMMVAFGNGYIHEQHDYNAPTANNNNNNHFHSRHYERSLSEIMNAAKDPDDEYDSSVYSASLLTTEKDHQLLLRGGGGHGLDNTIHDLQSKGTNFTEEFQQQADTTRQYYSNLVNDTLDALQKNITDQFHAIQDDMEQEYQQFQQDIEARVLETKQYLMQDVLWSYAMACAQMLLVYLITSPTVQAWVLRLVVHQIQRRAEQRLEEYGVSQALLEVLGERLGRVREQVLKLLRLYHQAKEQLDKVQSMLPGGWADKIHDAHDALVAERICDGSGRAEAVVQETIQGTQEAVQEAVQKKKSVFKRLFKKK